FWDRAVVLSRTVPAVIGLPVIVKLVPTSAIWVIRRVFQNEDRSPPRCVPEVLVMETLANFSVWKSASGRMLYVVASNGASLIASAVLRRQVALAGQALVRMKCRWRVVSEKVSVNLRVDRL